MLVPVRLNFECPWLSLWSEMSGAMTKTELRSIFSFLQSSFGNLNDVGTSRQASSIFRKH